MARGDTARFGISFAGPSPASIHLLHVDVLDPSAKVMAPYSGNVLAPAGRAAYLVPVARSDPWAAGSSVSGTCSAATFRPPSWRCSDGPTPSAAIIVPLDNGLMYTFNRRKLPPATSDTAGRDLTVMRVKDLGRSIDYLETRPDIREDQFGFYGASMGANYGPFLALKTAVPADGAFPSGRPRPEADRSTSPRGSRSRSL